MVSTQQMREPQAVFRVRMHKPEDGVAECKTWHSLQTRVHKPRPLNSSAGGCTGQRLRQGTTARSERVRTITRRPHTPGPGCPPCCAPTGQLASAPFDLLTASGGRTHEEVMTAHITSPEVQTNSVL